MSHGVSEEKLDARTSSSYQDEINGANSACSDRRRAPAVDISVIIPVGERVDNIRDLYWAYKSDLELTGRAYEMVFVLDGEHTSVLTELRALLQDGEPLKIIRLARAFGEATALTVGFANSLGPLLITMPAFYQVGEGAICRILDGLENCDMVIARRSPRTDSSFNQWQTRTFYRLQKLITGHEFHDLGCAARGFKREVIDEVSVYGDQHRFLPIFALRWGFRVKEIDLPQSPRDSFRRMYRPGIYLRRFLDLMTVFFLSKFTKKPLRFYGLIGTTIALVGGVTLVWLVFERLFLDMALSERPAFLLGSLLVVLGVQVFGLGLIGELIIFTHANDLKEYRVEELINYDDN